MDYRLKPLSKTCAATGEPFVPGQRCYSALVQRDGGLVRLDYSPQGWSGPPEGTIGYWRTVVPENEESESQPLDAEALMGYFEQLCEDANPAQDKFRYILALLLLQKRRLRLDGTRQDGQTEWLQVSGTRGEGPYEVPDYQLSRDDIHQLQKELTRHLSAE